MSYFIFRSPNFWRKCPCYLKFGTHALKEMFLKTVCSFFMKLFVSKDNFHLAKLFTNHNWPKSIKFIIAKTICILKKRAHVFSKLKKLNGGVNTVIIPVLFYWFCTLNYVLSIWIYFQKRIMKSKRIFSFNSIIHYLTYRAWKNSDYYLTGLGLTL